MMRQVMKHGRIAVLVTACIVVAGLFEAYAASYKVTIPFSLAGFGRPSQMSFNVPQGNYNITLKVERASWDHPGIADAVPIGLEAYATDSILGKYNPTGWVTGLGFVQVMIYVRPNSTLYTVFSTSAPAGARGTLTIQRIQ